MKFKHAIGGLWAMFSAAYLSLPPTVHALLALMVLDILSGVTKAYVQRTVSSDVSFRGMGKKVMSLFAVAAAVVMERFLTIDVPLTLLVAGFYCGTELISILENLKGAGVPVPVVLTRALEKYREETDVSR